MPDHQDAALLLGQADQFHPFLRVERQRLFDEKMFAR